MRRIPRRHANASPSLLVRQPKLAHALDGFAGTEILQLVYLANLDLDIAAAIEKSQACGRFAGLSFSGRKGDHVKTGAGGVVDAGYAAHARHIEGRNHERSSQRYGMSHAGIDIGDVYVDRPMRGNVAPF